MHGPESTAIQISFYYFFIIFFILSARPPQRIPNIVSPSAAKTATSFEAIEGSTPRGASPRGVEPSIAPKAPLLRHVMRP